MMIRAEDAGHGEEQTLLEWLAAQPGDPSFYAFLALLIFFGLLLHMGVHRTIAKTLDDRAEGISNELDEAKRLREDAAEMLASYQRKQREAAAAAELAAQAAEEILKTQLKKSDLNKLVDADIKTVGQRLN